MSTASARPRLSAGSLVSSDVRTHNLALVMRTLAEHGPSARSDLATATGLTRGAITALVAALADGGLVEESVSVPSAGSGRPKTLIGIAAADLSLVAVQIDADQVTVVVHDLAGAVLDRSATGSSCSAATGRHSRTCSPQQPPPVWSSPLIRRGATRRRRALPGWSPGRWAPTLR